MYFLVKESHQKCCSTQTGKYPNCRPKPNVTQVTQQPPTAPRDESGSGELKDRDSEGDGQT